MKNIVLSFIVVLILSLSVNAQQMIPLINSFSNQQVYNPGATGTGESEFNLSIISKLPTSFSSDVNRPLTNMLWADYRFTESKIAVGVNFNYETYGTISKSKKTQTDAMANLAYLLPLGNRRKLTFGLRGGVSNIKYNANELEYWDANDPTLNAYNDAFLLPKIGFGLKYDSKKLTLGASIPDLYVSDNANVLQNNDKSFMDKNRNYIAHAGYKINLSDRYHLLLNGIYYYYPSATATALGNLTFYFRDYFWIGASLGNYSTYALNAGAHVSSKIKFSYAYQSNYNGVVDARFNNHELNLMISLDELF